MKRFLALLITLVSTSHISEAQIGDVLYEQDFESYATPSNPVSQAWTVNGTTSNRWRFLSCILPTKSIGVVPPSSQNCGYDETTTTSFTIYENSGVNSEDYNTLTVTLDYAVGGDEFGTPPVDRGEIRVSTDGTNWTNISGTLINASATGASWSIPNGFADQARFYLGIFWVNDGSVTDDNTKGINVDNIVVTGDCKYTEPVVSTSDPLAYCTGEVDATLTVDAAEAGANYQWYKDGGSMGASYRTRTINVTQPGTYTVKITSRRCYVDAGNSLTIIEQDEYDAATISPAGPLTGCGSDPQDLVASPAPNYLWFKDGVQAIPLNQTNTLTITESGEYYVQSGCSGSRKYSDTVVVTYFPYPNVPNVTPSGTSQICEGESQVFTSDVANNIEWFFNGSATGVTTQSYEVSVAGDYHVEVTENGCTTASDTVTLVNNENPNAGTITPLGETDLCEGETVRLYTNLNAPIGGIISFGNDGYYWTRNLDKLATSDNAKNFTVSQSGTYHVVAYYVYGSDSCFAYSQPQIVTVTDPGTPPIITPVGPHNICTGETVQLTSDTPENIEWYFEGAATGITTTTYDAADSGYYHVVLTSGDCTAESDSVFVSVTDPIDASVTPNGDIEQCGGASLDLTTDQTSNFEWYKDGSATGVTTSTYSVSTSGEYYVVTNNNECITSSTDTARVTFKSKPATPNISTTDNTSLCPGDDATLISDAFTGNQWHEATLGLLASETNQSYVATTTGTYFVIITEDGCPSDTSNKISITANPKPATPSISTSDATTFCQGDDATLTSSSATGNQWYNASGVIGSATAQNFVATISGSYYVVVTENGCESDTSNHIVITVNDIPETPQIMSSPDPAVFCPGGNVTLSVSNSGVYSDPSYEWFEATGPTSAGSNATLVVSSAGTYYLVITESNCQSSQSSQITVSEGDAATPEISPDPAKYCPGDNVTLNVTNTDDYSGSETYRWYAEGDATIIGTGSSYTTNNPKTYYVVVTNGSCVSDESNHVTVTENTKLTPEVIPSPAKYCTGEDVTLSVDNASEYVSPSYQWYNASGPTAVGSDQESLTVSSNGDFYVVITDEGCVTANSNTVKVSEQLTADPEISASPASYCTGEDVTISVDNTNDYSNPSYQWYNASGPTAVGSDQESLTVSSDGDFYVVITDEGCTSNNSNTISITEKTTADPIVSPSSATYCTNGNVTLSVTNLGDYSGSQTYQWYDGSNTAVGTNSSTYSASSEDDYYVIITDEGCSSEKSNEVTVTENETITPEVDPSPASFCTGESVVLTVTNTDDYSSPSYQWYDGSDAMVGTDSESYSASAEDGYYVIVTDESCESDRSATVIVTEQTTTTPIISSNPNPAEVCDGESVTFTVTNSTAYTSPSYQWYQEGSPDVIVGTDQNSYASDVAGSFYVIVSDESCTSLASNSIAMTLKPLPVDHTISADGPLTFCAGDDVILTSSSVDNLEWYRSGSATGIFTQSLTVTTSGFYTVLANKDGCEKWSTDTVEVSVQNPTDTANVSVDGPLAFCSGDTTYLTSSIQTGIEWYDGANPTGVTDSVYPAIASGSYHVQYATGGCGSLVTDTIVIDVTQSPEDANLTADGPTTFCDGDQVTLNSSVSGIIKWYKDGVETGDTSDDIVVSEEGEYTVLAEENGCETWSSDTITVEVNQTYPKSSISYTGAITFCDGDSVELTSSETDEIEWYNSGTATGVTTANYFAKATGDYYVVSGSAPCTVHSDTVSVQVKDNPDAATVAALGPTEFCEGGSVELEATSSDNYVWFRNGSGTGVVNQNIIATESGVYYVVSDLFGCTKNSEDSISVIVNPTPEKALISNDGPLIFCEGNSVNLTSSVADSIEWIIDGAESGIFSTSINVTSSGTYVVRTSSSADCEVESDPVTVTVIDKPDEPKLSPTGPVDLCGGETEVLTSSETSNIEWYKDGVGLSVSTATLTVSDSGYYHVVRTENGCSSISDSVQVTEFASPDTAIISPSGTSEICSGDSVLLTSDIGTDIEWLRNGVGTGVTTQTYKATTAGTYVVRHTLGGGCSSDSDPVTVSVKPLPAAPLITPNDPEICDGEYVGLTSSDADDIVWYKDGVSTGFTAGTYYVDEAAEYWVVKTGANGCTIESNHVTTTVVASPSKPTVTPLGPTTFCEGESVNLLTDLDPSGDAFVWLRNGVVIAGTDNDATYTATESGQYSVEVTNADDCSTRSDVVEVTVKPNPPKPVITPNDPGVCEGDSLELFSSITTNIEWFFNGVRTGVTTPSYVAKDAGDYTVTVTSNGCTTTSDVKNFNVSPISETPVISAGGPTEFCNGGSVTLSSNLADDNQWYELSTGILTGETNQTLDVTTAGEYYAVGNAGCPSDESNHIIVKVGTKPTTPTISTTDGTTFCDGQTATLSSDATEGNQWYLDGVAVAGAEDQAHEARETGSYYVIVTIDGCPSDPSNSIAINTLPRPDSSSITTDGPTTFCTGDSVVLRSSELNGIEWYLDGVGTGVTTPEYSAKVSGSYTVVTTLGGCPTPARDTVVVNVLNAFEHSTITADGSTTICPGSSVELTSSIHPGIEWYIDGVATGIVTKTIDATQAGEYFIQGETGSCSQITSDTITVTLFGSNPSTVTPSGTTEICEGDDVTLTTSATVDFEWYFNDVATGVITQDYTVSEAGTYHVVITSTDGCETESNKATVQVNPLPAQASITASGSTAICEGDDVTLTSSIATNIEWYVDGVATGVTTQDYTVSTAGSYTVETTSAKDCKNMSDPVEVTVLPVYEAPTITLNGTDPFCEGDWPTLTSSIADGNQWYRDGSPIGGATDQEYEVRESGEYTLIVTLGTCETASNDTVSLTMIPVSDRPTIAPDGEAIFCEGGQVVLRSSVAASYQWYKDGVVIPAATNRQYTATTTGDYVVEIPGDGTCDRKSEAFHVEVNPAPAKPVISPSADQAICFGDPLTLTSDAADAYQWYNSGSLIPNATNQTYDVTVSGSYTVRVSNAEGCDNTSEAVNVTVILEDEPTIDVDPSTTICDNEEAVLTSSYATGNQWYYNGGAIPGATESSYTTNLAGTYRVLVSEGSCTRFSQEVVITVNPAPAKPSISPSGEQLICKTQSLTLTSSATANNQWYRDGVALVGERSQTYEATEGGKYTVTVSSANGCSATSDTTTVTVRFEDGVTITPSDTTVCSNEIVTLTSSEPVGNQWFVDGFQIPGATGQTYDVNAPGSYTVQVIRDGCITQSDAVVITHVAAPAKPDIQTDDNTAFCGGESARLYTNAAAVNYQWYKDGLIIPGAIASTHDATETGDYQIEVQNAAGCKEKSDVLSIQLFAQPRIANTVVTDNPCFGREEGSIKVTAQDGSAPYSYSLDGANYQAGNTFSNLAAGTYMVYLIDAKGCEDSTEVTVNDADESLEVSVNLDRDIRCADEDNGQITATGTGGGTTYEYSLNQTGNYQSSGTFSGLPEGEYKVTVRDENGCIAISEPVFITNPDSMFVTATRDNDITCFNDNDGKITTTMEGGTRPYLYSIDGVNFQNDSLFINLEAGTYRVTVQDARGCRRFSDPVVITNPAPLEFQSAVFVQNAQCFGERSGRIAVVASGGTEGYTYFADLDQQQGGQPSDTIDVFAGTYKVWVEDANGCVDSAINFITITEPDEIIANIDLVQQIQCFQGTDGAIHVSASGGTGGLEFTIGGFDPNPLLTNTTGQFENLTEGFYQVQVRDANGCTVDLGMASIFPKPPFTLAATPTHVSCFGFNDGSIQAIPTGGATGPKEFRIEGETAWGFLNTFSNLSPGTYTVQVRDVRGCIAEIVTTITEPPLLSVIASGTDISCFGLEDGMIDAIGSGGFGQLQYTVSSSTHPYSDGPQPNGSFTGLPEGRFAVVVTDGNGCTAISDSIDIIEPAEVFVTIAKVNDVICNGAADGRIQATSGGGVGGYEYKLTGSHDSTYQSDRLFEGLAPGTYAVTTRDANGCTSFSGTITIIEPPLLRITASQFTDITCYGANDGIIEFAAVGGVGFIQYSVNGVDFFNTGLFENLAPGVYAITARDQKGCISAAVTDTIREPGELIAFADVDQHISCNGETDGQITVLMSGGIPPFEYSIDGGTTYQSSPTFANLPKNNYVFYVRDANGCETISNATNIIDPPQISVVATLEEEISCHNANDGVITATGFGGTGTYLFSLDGFTFTPNNVFSGLAPGTYSVYIKDVNSCISIAPAVVVTNPAALVLNIDVLQNASCYNSEDGRIRITGSGGAGALLYSIDNGDHYQSAQVFNNLAAGNYACVVKDANGCTLTKSVDVLSPERFDISTTDVHHYYSPTDKGYIDLEVNNIIPPVSYMWSHGATTQDVTGLGIANYTCFITDGNGCVQDTTISINDSTSVGIEELASNISIYPNPSTGLVTVQWEGWNAGDTYRLEVLNGIGEVVYRKTMSQVSESAQMSIDLTGKSEGVYFVQIYDQDQTPISTLRLMLQ